MDVMDGGVARPLSTLTLALVVLLVAGCGSGGTSLLSDLRLSSTVVAPTGAGDTPPIAVRYGLSRPATVSAYLTSDSSERLYLRREEPRPAAGEYVLGISGAYAPDPAGDERRVLPSGSYRLVIEAHDASGVQQQSAAQVEIRDADTTLPTIENLTLFPAALSPNFDGIDDTTRISYRTTKQATVTLLLVSESSKRYVLEREERQHPGEHATTWNGLVGNQVLPTGSYQLVAQAQDAAGNVSVARETVRVDASSMPDAHILSVDFEPRRILVGGTVKVEIRVKNSGNTVLRSQGPDPGHSYDSLQSFGTIEEGKYPDQRGFWRVGVDWTADPNSLGASGSSGSKYPYRWGFGKDLQPGEETTVVGYLRIDRRYPRIWLYAGLVQEQAGYRDDEVGRTLVEISY